MNNQRFDDLKRKITYLGALTLLGATCIIASPTAVLADGDAVTMAPPIDEQDAPPANASAASTVFNWQEVPANQQVPIKSAVFDQGGYQLYDTVGETIVVKFKDDNLYVMKFAVSPNDTMYFVNSGSSPVLYVPEGGYIENATVSGARWYPFTDSFQPSTPVFLGVAPTWSDYDNIGWYPNMSCYGGYWCDDPYGVGVFGPSLGLSISFGGHHFDGWGGYLGFVGLYPAPYHIGFYHDYVYGFARQSYWGTRQFHGYNGGFGYHGGGFRGGYAGGYHGGTFGGSHSFGNSGYRGETGFSGGGFRGGAFGSEGFRGGSGEGSHGSFEGNGFNGGGFRGGSFGNGHSSFGGGGYGGGGFSNGRSGFGGGSFNGSGSRGGSFGGGGHASFGGGAHSGGGDSHHH